LLGLSVTEEAAVEIEFFQVVIDEQRLFAQSVAVGVFLSPHPAASNAIAATTGISANRFNVTPARPLELRLREGNRF
jgi:hypothetical protein